jgi:hypothetical protein
MQGSEAEKEETGHEPGREVTPRHIRVILGALFYRLKILTVYIIPGILCY